MQITLRSYAKITKNLVVGEKKGDFHLIDGDLALIELHAELTFDINPSDTFENEVSVYVSGELVNYELIKKTVNLWAKERKYPVKVTLNIENPLPLEAGLGAMSSYAASTINALEKAYADANKNDDNYKSLTLYEKLNLARSIGMDTIFFASGLGKAHVRGYGQVLTPRRPTNSKVILHFPDYKSPTGEAYEDIDEERVKSFIELKRNRLYLEKLIQRTGTDLWRLSGSGSTFFIERPPKNIIEKVDEWNREQIHCILTKTKKGTA